MDPHRGLSLRGDATNALPLLEPGTLRRAGEDHLDADVFGSMVGFSGTADPTAPFPVGSNSRWRPAAILKKADLYHSLHPPQEWDLAVGRRHSQQTISALRASAA